MKTRFLSYKFILSLVVSSAFFLVGCEKTLDLQQVAVVEVTNITSNSAECKVTVQLNNSEKITERGIAFDSKEWKNQVVIVDANSGTGTFSLKMENLLPGAIYGVRGYATNSEGTVFSSVFSFTTPLKKGTMTDIDDNEYETVVIGKQEWMTQNMRTTKFNDGSAIKLISNNSSWQTANTSGAYCYYGNDEANKEIYGCIYNWRAAGKKTEEGKNLFAPEGWRVPTIEDWTALKDHLILHRYGFKGVEDNVIGKAMASKTLWNESTVEGAVGYEINSNNSSEFNALPGGFRSNKGVYGNLGEKAYFWSNSTVEGVAGAVAYYVSLSFDESAFATDSKELAPSTGGYNKLGGLAVRCVRDVE